MIDKHKNTKEKEKGEGERNNMNIWTIELLPEFFSDTQTCLYEITCYLHKIYAIWIVIISFKYSHKIVFVLLNNIVLTNNNIIFNDSAIF